VAISKKFGTVFSGGVDGKIYIWQGGASKKQVKNNDKAVHSMAVQNGDDLEELLIVGGQDKTINIYSIDANGIKKKQTIKLESFARALDIFKG
jgi:WD40 repeat protein